MGIRTGLITAIFALAACKVVFPTVTPAPPVVTDQANCAAACNKLDELACPEANPIRMQTTCKVDADCLGPTGTHDQFQTCASNGVCQVTCPNFCISTENTGVFLDPTCVMNITSCDQVDTCVSNTTGTSCTGPTCKIAPSHGAH